MKTIIVRAALAALIAGVFVAPAFATRSQEQGALQVPAEEAKAFEPVKAATTAPDVLKAAEAFVGKYPKSAALNAVEVEVYNRIIDSPADATRLPYIDAFKKLFPTSDRAIDLDRSMFDYYLKEGKLAEINKANEAYLAKKPDDVRIHLLLTTLAIEGIKRQDTTLYASGKMHGKRAIEIFEGTARPSVFVDDAAWQAYKAANVGVAYQGLAIISLAEQDMPTAAQYFEKAIAASPAEPLNYFYLANVRHNEKYVDLAKQYNDLKAKNSPDAAKTLEQVNAVLDEEVKLLAKAVAYSEGNATYGPIYTQAKPLLEEVYKQRHGNLDGLDALVKGSKGAQ